MSASAHSLASQILSPSAHSDTASKLLSLAQSPSTLVGDLNILYELINTCDSLHDWRDILRANAMRIPRRLAAAFSDVFPSLQSPSDSESEQLLDRLVAVLLVLGQVDDQVMSTVMGDGPALSRLAWHLSTSLNIANRLQLIRLGLEKCDASDVLVDAYLPTVYRELLYVQAQCDEDTSALAVECLLLVDRLIPETETLLKTIAICDPPHPQASSISEQIIRICNTSSGKTLSSALIFTSSCLRGGRTKSSKATAFFFPSDVHVFIEVLIRELTNLSTDSPLLMTYICCLDSVLRWPQYVNSLWKAPEIVTLLNQIDQNIAHVSFKPLTTTTALFECKLSHDTAGLRSAVNFIMTAHAALRR